MDYVCGSQKRISYHKNITKNRIMSVNIVFLEVYSSPEDFKSTSTVKLPLESLITYSVYQYCSPQVTLKLIYVEKSDNTALELQCDEPLNYVDAKEIPWQVSACLYPVVMHMDTVITGLCAVARHLTQFRTLQPSPYEHEDSILGFRRSCLQAPNEVSIWTKFCEVNIVKTVIEVLNIENIQEIPKNLVRFENHLSKPVRVHNVYKLAREIKIINVKKANQDPEKEICEHVEKLSSNESVTKFIAESNTRSVKTRKWKSKIKKQAAIHPSTRIEDLDISHQFAEGPFLTLADLVLLPSYEILIKSIGESVIQSILPLTYKWYANIIHVAELKPVMKLLKGLLIKTGTVQDLTVPTMENVSLYKCDPKRHNPKRRLFTKEDDIENALTTLIEGMELKVESNNKSKEINWNEIPDGANPLAGHLPDERMARKSQQLENLALAVMSIAKDGDVIVDFCSGSGHLGILLAHLLPKCIVILLENKEQSLLRARNRIHEMGIKNVYFYQCNLDFFIGKFDIGIALHACGIASDLVLDKCLKANAKFVLCPCCYGSLHATDRLVYPRSDVFKNVTIDQYLCIGHAADQTHKEHPLTMRGDRCMAVIDSDRGRLAEQFGYKVTLSRLKPLSCTPKNNLLVGVPS